MTLAQVVYQFSTDNDFAEKMRSNPEVALAQKGLKLSKEELSFLSMGFRRYSPEKTSKINLANVGYGMPWVA